MSVTIKNVSISITMPIHNHVILFKDFYYEIPKGKVLTIMGASGSGKSTLLHYITGIYDTKVFSCTGEILVGERNIIQENTEKRRIGLLSQEGLLFPHMTVAENLMYALPASTPKKEKKEIVARTLEESQLTGDFIDKYPSMLSGGQQARLSLARTLLSHPHFLLLDEPFSKLDANLRKDIRNLVWQKIQDNNIPTLIVTHDREDIHDTSFVYEHTVQ